MNLLEDLNSEQREAVLATEGPLVVLAGAGTGKTRVITYRIAYLIERGAAAEGILGVTFTNKASDQMRDRVRDLLIRAGLGAGKPWLATFHSFCARLLRREAPRLGLRPDFAIYDADDQAAALRLAAERLHFEERGTALNAYQYQISYAKSHALTAEHLAAEASSAASDFSRRAVQIYEAYETVLRQAGALDFDDLLLRAAQVLRERNEARRYWQARFRYILVDEFQDTNRPQYELLKLLVGAERNLCVVGDEDQSIYSWRGATVTHLLRFADDFPGARLVRLEENYRSSQPILDAASAVVAHNQQRIGKQLTARRGTGPLAQFYEARDARAEAEYVASQIRRLQREDPGAHLAVLYRANAQSRSFEDALRAFGVHYRLLGGFSFYQRAEVKDALAYARLAVNPNDDVSLLRVINTPPRGIGEKSVEVIRRTAQERGLSLWAAMGAMIEEHPAGLAPLRGFRALLEQLQQDASTLGPDDFLRQVLERSGYLDMLAQRGTEEDTSRTENLQELLNAVVETTGPEQSLTDFLDRAALVSDADSFDERAPVTLMTLHSAKGLEFEHVFLTGLEEGVFPHVRSSGTAADMEEERRLCYVGMTRAKNTLTLTRAIYRRTFGRDHEGVEGSKPSRFLSEIPSTLLETASGSLSAAGAERHYETDPEYSYSAAEFARRVRRLPATSEHPRAGRHASVARRREPAASGHPLIGVQVRHPNYGLGTIIGVDGDDQDRKLTVRFSSGGTKKLVERYANLTVA
jgi:DNA helicase II / ATP-dependent DNA helicase PcrA